MKLVFFCFSKALSCEKSVPMGVKHAFAQGRAANLIKD